MAMRETFGDKLRKLEIIGESAPGIDKRFAITRGEFVERRRQVWAAVTAAAGVDVAFAFSDEHYSGDVPYLGAILTTRSSRWRSGWGRTRRLQGSLPDSRGSTSPANWPDVPGL